MSKDYHYDCVKIADQLIDGINKGIFTIYVTRYERDGNMEQYPTEWGIKVNDDLHMYVGLSWNTVAVVGSTRVTIKGGHMDGSCDLEKVVHKDDIDNKVAILVATLRQLTQGTLYGDDKKRDGLMAQLSKELRSVK